MKVAVLGAGAAGLAASRVLREAGIRVTCYEKDAGVGGVWRYKPGGVMYRGLVTNLPKQIMAYFGFPFPDRVNSFLTHEDVQRYLQHYCAAHDLNPLIKFCHDVTAVGPVETVPSRAALGGPSWDVRSRAVFPPNGASANPGNDREISGNGEEFSEVFDAVVVCNGHYEVPSAPKVPGTEKYSGRVLHSREYDVPLPFAGRRVLCVGARASGTDLAREIAEVAAEVHVCDRDAKESSRGGAKRNIWRRPAIRAFDGGLAVTFEDSTNVEVDNVIYCTGYDYDFPFLQSTNLELTANDRHVAPLWLQLFHVEYPTLSFVGLPHSVVPFPLFELQARLVAAALTGKAQIPDRNARLREIAREGARRAEFGLRERDAHYLGEAQWEYCKKLAEMAGCLDESLSRELALREKIYNDAGNLRKGFPGDPDTYRLREYHPDWERGTFETSWAKRKAQIPSEREERPADAVGSQPIAPAAS